MDTDRTHVLIVDDFEDAADSMAELLSIWGYDSCACYCGATGLASAITRRPCLVLLDVAMPRMDGYRFAELFRELPECGSVPIVAVSGYSGAAYSARAREVGIQHYLLKPIDPNGLRELLALHMVPRRPRPGEAAPVSEILCRRHRSSLQLARMLRRRSVLPYAIARG